MTFLVTPKMSPELAERVEASVRGHRRGRRRERPMVKTAARALFLFSITAAVIVVLRTQEQSRRQRESARDALADSVAAANEAISKDDRKTVERVETWAARLAAGYEGDVVTPDWRAALGRPAIYIRDDDSVKDSLLYCLVDPPTARTEKTVLVKVRASRTAQLETTTPNVRHLLDAKMGLPYLSPAFAASVRSAKDLDEIEALRGRFTKAPIGLATQALRAEVLIAVVDEPGTPPTELDGERPHDIRLAVIDLRADKVLFRARKHVDPAWVSPDLRPHYARGLDSCALAFDLR